MDKDGAKTTVRCPVRPARAAASVACFSKSVSEVLLSSRVMQGPSGFFGAGGSELEV